MLEKKNQAFVVGHRNGILLFSCEKFMDYFCQELPKYEVGSVVSKKLFDVLELMFRLSMNASHSNGNNLKIIMTIVNFFSRSLRIETWSNWQFSKQFRLYSIQFWTKICRKGEVD